MSWQGNRKPTVGSWVCGWFTRNVQGIRRVTLKHAGRAKNPQKMRPTKEYQIFVQLRRNRDASGRRNLGPVTNTSLPGGRALPTSSPVFRHPSKFRCTYFSSAQVNLSKLLGCIGPRRRQYVFQVLESANRCERISVILGAPHGPKYVAVLSR